jgi:hypothetical protein
MTDYKALLEWLTLPLRPRLRAERKERKRLWIIRAVEQSEKELRKIPAKIRPRFEEIPLSKTKKRK